MERYRVVRDRQGGEFGMGRDYTALEWLEQMLEWRDADDSFGDYEITGDPTSEEYLDTYEGCKAYWEKKIKDGKELDLINYISDIWDLDFEKVGGEND